MITRIDPADYVQASTVQVESDAASPWTALEEIEDWAAANGFVRTSEYQPRQVLAAGGRRFVGICYRLSAGEAAALEASQQRMVERGEALRVNARQTAGEGS